MSEQAAPAEGGATPPAVAGPEGTPGATEQQAEQQQVDWQERYQHLQPEYTRATQRVSLYEQMLTAEDEDTRREAAEQLGYQFAEDAEPEQPETSDDPLSAYQQRLEALEQHLAARDQEAQDDAYAQQVRVAVDERLDSLQIPKDDQDWVLAYAINALPITEEGLPDVEQAYEALKGREVARQREWAHSKRSPRISPDGQAATEAPNLDNRQDRQDFIMRRLQDGEQAGY